MDKLKPNVVALSVGVTAGILSFLCLILIAALPLEMMTKIANSLMHGIDISGIAAKNITLLGALAGIVEWFLIGIVAGYIFALAYNWIGEKL